jgi:hypothetical protein
MISSENKKYIIYLVKYLGVALIAGSVVHVGTLHGGTIRYIVLGVIGLFLMMLGNIIEAKHNGEKINAKYLFVITGLSLATGFLSGGIQHYFDNPVYAGYLLAIGLIFSYIIFFIKDKIKVLTRNVLIVALVSVFILIISMYIPATVGSGHHSGTDENTNSTTTIQLLGEVQIKPHSH